MVNQDIYRPNADAFTGDINVTAYNIPTDLDRIWNSIFTQLSTDGFSVVEMHGGEFQNFNMDIKQYDDSINETFVNQMRYLITNLKRVGIKMIHISDIDTSFSLQRAVSGGVLPT